MFYSRLRNIAKHLRGVFFFSKKNRYSQHLQRLFSLFHPNILGIRAAWPGRHPLFMAKLVEEKVVFSHVNNTRKVTRFGRNLVCGPRSKIIVNLI